MRAGRLCAETDCTSILLIGDCRVMSACCVMVAYGMDACGQLAAFLRIPQASRDAIV